MRLNWMTIGMDLTVHVVAIFLFLLLFMPQTLNDVSSSVGYIIALSVWLKIAELIVFRE